MNELRKIEKLPPVRLYIKDLFEFENILKSETNWGDNDFKIDIVDGPKTILANSAKELPLDDLPRHTDNISFKIIGWGPERKIVNGVTIIIHHNYAQYQIHSLTETWFFGKSSQIDSFFKKRKPWYSWLTKSLSYITGFIIWPSILAAAWGYKAGLPWVTFLSSTLFASIVIISWLSYKQKLFPYVRVYFSEKPKQKSSYEFTVILLELAILVATILSIIIPMILNTK